MAQLKQTTISGGLEVTGQTSITDLEVKGNATVATGLEIQTGVTQHGAVNLAVGVNDLLDLLYPVGSIYMTIDEDARLECPIAKRLGGEWERINNAFLYAADDNDYPMDNTKAMKKNEMETHGSNDAVVVSHSHNLSQNVSVSVSLNDALEDSTVYTGRGEFERNLHTVMTYKDNSTANGTNGIIQIDSGYSSYSPSGWADYHMQEVQIRPNQWHKPDRLKFKVKHSHTATASVTQPQIQSYGESATDANMPKHVRVYVWRRIPDKKA